MMLIRAKFRVPEAPEIVAPHYPIPEDNGFPLLLDASSALREDKTAIGDAQVGPWEVRDAAATQLLVKHAGPLRVAREALSKDCLLPRPVNFDQEFDYLRDFRSLARLLILQGRQHEREGRHDDAADCYCDGLRLAQVATRNGGMMHGLSGISIVAMLAPDFERCIGSGNVPGSRLNELQSVLDEAWQKRVPWHETLAIEWTMMDQGLESIVKGDADRNAAHEKGQPPGWFRKALGGALFSRSRSEIQLRMAEMIADAKKPYWQRSYHMPKPKTMMGEMMLGGISRVAPKVAERDTLLQGLHVLTALERFRRERGDRPESLSELAPEFLSKVPPDPFDGKPFRYRRTDSSYVLYSVGPDKKDGGGKRRLHSEANTGDIIIWPWGRVRERREPEPEREGAR